MDIIIKSFNRPYYLDRCLYSIYDKLKGDYKIIVIDDGTPEKYLEKIRNKYPSIKVIRTELADYKTENLLNKIHGINKHVSGYPTKDWIKAVEDSNYEYVFVTEDDVWFTREVNLDTLLSEMKQFNISLLKLAWKGVSHNEKLYKEIPLSKNSVRQIPENLIRISKKNIHRIFFNQYKIKSILHRLRIINNGLFKKYYLLISISMGIHKKDYWLKTWKGVDGDYMELNQLSNVGSVYSKKTVIARTTQEYLTTTYISSATMSDHKTTTDFDIDFFNYIINEEWYNDNFDALNNYPNDFSEKKIEDILKKYQLKQSSLDDWKLWIKEFKENFRRFGDQVKDNP